MPWLEVGNLTRRFGGLSAVSDLGFAVEEGEIRGLVGPNGAGKTTAFTVITGFYRPTAGLILYRGEDISGRSTNRIAQRGLARESCGTDDPRLATALANQAQALRRRGRDPAARGLFEEALLVWDGSGPWRAALAPERRARSSTLHLRLESKHPDVYARHARERYQALAAEGRAALIALRDQKPPPFDGPARWAQDRPQGYTDARKLMVAVLLVAAHRK